MKVRTLLVAAVMILAFSAAAFAQATFSVGSTPVTAVISTGLAEKTGDVTFTVTSGTSLTGTISINYSGVPITSPSANIQTYVNGVLQNPSLVNGSGTALGSGLLVINIPANLVSPNTIRIAGVRVAVANTGLTSLNAQISTTINAITAGQTVVQVISAISPGITVSGTSKSIASTAPVTQTATMKATEVFLNAFGAAADDGNVGPATGVPGALMVRFTLSAAPPTGMTLTLPLTVSAPTTGGTAGNATAWAAADSTGVLLTTAPSFTSASTSLAAYYKVVSDSDPIVLESLAVPVVATFASGTTVVGANSITFTGTLAPIGASSGTNSTLIPRYTVSESAATTLFTFTGSATAMLVPYANVATAINYDTGIAISNTTEDPGATAMGLTGNAAVAQPGGFTVYFFPQSGTNFSVSSTTAIAGATGLDATGKIPAGGTFVALLSSIVKAAQTANPTITIPNDFTGYLIIVTNFTNAHGLATVSNFETYTQASPVLIIGADRATETGLNN